MTMGNELLIENKEHIEIQMEKTQEIERERDLRVAFAQRNTI